MEEKITSLKCALFNNGQSIPFKVSSKYFTVTFPGVFYLSPENIFRGSEDTALFHNKDMSIKRSIGVSFKTAACYLIERIDLRKDSVDFSDTEALTKKYANVKPEFLMKTYEENCERERAALAEAKRPPAQDLLDIIRNRDSLLSPYSIALRG